ncbi:MAG TPA: fumarylacetoacetate hydrolase family protein [Sphingobium sp.]
MKLLRYRWNDGVRPGVLVGEHVLALDRIGFPTMRDVIAGGAEALEQIRAYAATAAPDAALADVEILAPVERPGKYLAIGMNYPKHLEEADRAGVPRFQHQVWFNKQTTCIVGPHDLIVRGVTEKLDYEVELAVVVGKTAKHVSEANAQDYVFGYMVANDVSARDWQFHSNTMTMGKSFDTHGPIGPWIVTADEIADPHRLNLRCYVNGELRQSNNTGKMIANIWQQIAYLSKAFTLEPGDLLATGTPEGVGVAREPQCFLQAGDIVRCEIDGIGTIENQVVEA